MRRCLLLAGLLRKLVAYAGLRAWKPLDRHETNNCEGDEQERLSHEERRLSLRRRKLFERRYFLECLHHPNKGVQIQRERGRNRALLRGRPPVYAICTQSRIAKRVSTQSAREPLDRHETKNCEGDQ